MNASPAALLTIWVIYKDPRDYPGKFVVRCQDVSFEGNITAHADCTVHESLSAARVGPAERGLVRIGRHPKDEPQIVECWV